SPQQSSNTTRVGSGGWVGCTRSIASIRESSLHEGCLMYPKLGEGESGRTDRIILPALSARLMNFERGGTRNDDFHNIREKELYICGMPIQEEHFYRFRA